MSDDPELDDLLGDVVRSVDEDIGADSGCPDLAAVMARAHELDPQRVPAEVVAEVSQWAPVVSIQQGHRRRRTRDDEELLAVIEGVRAHVEEDVAQRLGTPPPVASMPPAQSPRSSRWVWGPVLLAAAVLLLVGASVLREGRWRLVRTDPSASEAVRVEPSPSQARARVPGVVEERVEEPAKASPAKEEPQVEAAETPAAEEAEAEGAPTPAVPLRRKPAKRAPPMSLEELDAAAHAAWRAGDLPEAERLFRRLAKRAGKARLGDLAYGDLFTLARQTHQPGKEASLWREYLRRFPRGRFADDARAGLCRRASEKDERDCWQRYLDDMPDGAHRARAQRALASTGDAP